MKKYTRHSAGIFRDINEQAILLRQFFLDAKLQGNQLTLFLHGEDKEQFLSLIDCPELMLQKGLSQGWFTCHSALDVYAPSGKFLISEMYEKLNSSTEQALKGGYSGLSAAGQMTWANEVNLGLEILAEYECGLNSVFENQPKLQGLCLYSQDKFQAQDITLQCLCHPNISTISESSINPYSEFENIDYSHSFPCVDVALKYWLRIQRLGCKIESLNGKKASFARKILEHVRSNLYLLFVDDSKIHKQQDILRQIDVLSQKIDYLVLKEAVR